MTSIFASLLLVKRLRLKPYVLLVQKGFTIWLYISFRNDQKKTKPKKAVELNQKIEKIDSDEKKNTPLVDSVDNIITDRPCIKLGKNCDKGTDVKFDPVTSNPKKLANQHLLIVGKSGAGKSQTTSSFLFELNSQGIPFLILDFQGEYVSSGLTNSSGDPFMEITNSVDFDPSRGMDINPLELSTNANSGQKVSYMNNVYQVSGILKQIFGLGEIQHPILKDAI